MRPTALLACLVFAAGAPLADAADDTTKAGAAAEATQKGAGMSAEDKAAARKKSKAKWEAMSPEQKAEAKSRRAAGKPERAAAPVEQKDVQAGKPTADLPPPSAGPR